MTEWSHRLSAEKKIKAIPAIIGTMFIAWMVTWASAQTTGKGVGNAEGQENAEALIVHHLEAMKDAASLMAKFACEKQLSMIATPLESAGEVWIQKPNSLRFSTEKPYLSEVILSAGNIWQKSQHEKEWTPTRQENRPGLTAIMGQMAGWFTGDAHSIRDMYGVEKINEGLPPNPIQAQQARDAAGDVELFLLKPKNADLAKAVKELRIGIDRKTHYLRFVQLITSQDDVTRYWFFDIQLNPILPGGIFKPSNG